MTILCIIQWQIEVKSKVYLNDVKIRKTKPDINLTECIVYKVWPGSVYCPAIFVGALAHVN